MNELQITKGAVALTTMPDMQVIAILVKRLGGEVFFSQADFDGVAYAILLEGRRGDELALQLVESSKPQ